MNKLYKSLYVMMLGASSVLLFNGCEPTPKADEYKADDTTRTIPDFRGSWEVTDSSENKFDITLNSDGTATSTLREFVNGKWKVVQKQKVQIQWANGANDFIFADQDGYTRISFGPGQPPSGTPQETSSVTKKGK
jgi:hypothetical protein